MSLVFLEIWNFFSWAILIIGPVPQAISIISFLETKILIVRKQSVDPELHRPELAIWLLLTVMAEFTCCERTNKGDSPLGPRVRFSTSWRQCCCGVRSGGKVYTGALQRCGDGSWRA